METNSGKASDPILTEEAYDEGKILQGIQAKLESESPLDDSEQEIFWRISQRKNFEALHSKISKYGPPKSFADMERRYPIIATLEQLRSGVVTRDEWDYYCDLKRMFDPSPVRAKNGRPKGTWELTLTYAPKWYQDDHEAQEAFRTAEKRLIKYYADELELYRSVGEFTKDGRAHLHILYRLGSGGKFTDKNISRAYPKWNPRVKVGKGNQGGHHAICESQSDYAGYIEKHLKEAWHHYEHKPDANDSARA